MFKVMADNNVNISASQDGAIYDVFAGHQNFIIGEVGDEFEITTTESSLAVSVGTGEAIISGRHITAQEDNSITLPASSTVYLCLRIDLTQTAGNEGQLVALTTDTAMRSDNLNAGGTVCDLLLYTVQTSTNGVSSKTDGRVMLSATSGALVATINYSIPSEAYQNNTSGDWAKQFYADVPCTFALETMVADVNPNTSLTNEDDYGLLKATQIIANGTIRCYFKEKPTNIYAITSFLLTVVREENEPQDAMMAAKIQQYYAQKAIEDAEKQAEIQAEIEAEKKAEEERQAQIEAQKEARLQTMEVNIANNTTEVKETSLKTNSLSTMSIAPLVMNMKTEEIPVSLGEFTENIATFEVGKELKANEPFVYNGIVGIAPNGIASGNVWEPYWNEDGTNNGNGTETVFRPRPKQNPDGTYNYIYGMRADKGMRVWEDGILYEFLKNVDPVVWKLSDLTVGNEVSIIGD